MQDITKPSRALLRSTYNDEEIPSNSAYDLAVNGYLAQRHLRIIDMSWMHARLPRISRRQYLLPLADTRRNQAPPPIASISVPNTSQTSGRRIRRVRRYDPYSRNNEIRRKELGDFFKPMFEKDSPVIFICWGRKERCQIVPVVITDPTDEVTAWQAISREFYAQRGVWAKYLPWFCVNKVEIVDVCGS